VFLLHFPAIGGQPDRLDRDGVARRSQKCGEVWIAKLHANPFFIGFEVWRWHLVVVLTRNTFYGTRYLSHCCAVFCSNSLRSFFYI